MQAISPQDRNKVIGLVGGIVLVFGFIGFRLMSMNGGSAPSASQKADEASIIGGPPTTVAAAEPEDDLIEIPTMYVGSNADPFRVILQPVQPKPVRSTTRRPPVIRTADRTFERPTGEIPPFDPRQMDVNPLPQESVSLSGVMSGGDGVAVVRVGSQDFVVKRGDTFGNGYKLTKVSDSGVEISRGSQKMNLSVGSSS